MRLLGREEEVRRLRRLLDEARGGTSGVLVVRGEPGVGKTALLQDAEEAAGAGMRVVAVTGVESERELGYAALHRLVGPFLDRRATLPAPQRDALEVAFGLVSGVPADRFVMCLAVLTLLAEAATEQPLLCVCDDAQWIDQESLQVLAFLARRMDADPIALLLGVREGIPGTGTDPVPALADLPTLRLDGLPSDAARALALEFTHGRFDPAELDRLILETGGNPLAIRELAVDWVHVRGGWARAVPLAQRLPLGEVLEARFRDRVATLPAPVRTLLLVAAAEPTGDPDLVWRALTALGATGEATTLAAAAEPARALDLLVLEPALRFRHPLVRSAVYGGADEASRRAVHAALAAAIPAGTDRDRRAWHVAAATPGPDERVAAELEAAAGRARDRAGYSAEAAFLAAAADRTTDPELRARRLFGGAVAAMRAGLPLRAHDLLDHVPAGASAAMRSTMALTRGAACMQLDRFTEGLDLMTTAASEISTVLPPPMAREGLLHTLQKLAIVPWNDLVTVARLFDGPAGGVAALPDDPRPADVMLDAHLRYLLGPPRPGLAALRRMFAVLRADPRPEETELRGPLLIATTREVLDDEVMIDLTGHEVRLARGFGAARSMWVALVGQSITETLVGHFGSAELYHAEALQVALVNGGTPYSRRRHDALLAAWRGNGAALAAAAGEVPPRPPGRATGGTPVQMVRMAQGVLALAEGRYADATAAGRQIYDDAPPYLGHLPLPDLVEAAARSGDRDLAEAALRRFADRADAVGTPWALGLLARSRALLAEGTDAEALHREAVDRLAGTRIVPELARAHLLHGEWLRRRRRRTEARHALGRAHAMFTTLGAAAFAERARGELVAAGATIRGVRPTRAAADTLTAHEARIARLAAAGSTNQQIATELYISPNTVEYHLRKVFHKTGVSSRRDLAAVALDA